MTQCERILELLEERGEQGASNYELNLIAFRYSARIKDLRDQGYKISAKHINNSKWLFRLEPSQIRMFS